MMKKKHSIIIIVLLIVCLLILLCLIYFLNKQYKIKKYEEKIAEFQEFRKEYESETILARNPTVIFGYDGEYDRDYLYKDMKRFSDYMYYLKENIKNKDTAEFFNEHQREITEYVGITTQDEFVEFIQNLQNSDIKKENFQYAEFIPKSVKKSRNYFSFKINFYYGNSSDNAKATTFKVEFANYKDLKVDVKYKFEE